MSKPDPISLLLPNNGDGLAVPEDSNVGSGCAQQLGGDGTERAGAGSRRRPDASPMRSARSTDIVNQEAPGWTKRCDPISY